MTHDTVATEQRWERLADFPSYLVSNHGVVVNDNTGITIKPTKSTHGGLMVGLMKDGIQHKRSLPLLVAQLHIPRPSNEIFDTPIHLDGNREHVNAHNLMWRPLWFSRRYMRQFTDNHVTYNAPIEDVETGEYYNCTMRACTIHGLLDNDLLLSMHNNGYVWPTGQVFRKVRPR